jgi:type I restriction enzyme S subunit
MEMLDIEVFEVVFKETELGPMPEEWEVVRLGEVAEIIMGQSPPGETYNTQGVGMPFLQGKAEFGKVYPSPVKYTTNPLKIGKTGSVLISVRAPVGDVNIANMDYCIGRGLASISFKNGYGCNEYLFYCLQFLKPLLEKEGYGSTFKAINKEVLTKFQIPLPPLEEQKAIAGILSTVQSAIEKTEKVINALKNLKKSMMKHLFTYGPVAEEEAEKVELKETEIGPIPKHWEVMRLGEVAEIIMGQSPPGETYNTQGVGMPFLQGKAEFGKVYPSPVKYTTNPLKIGKTGSVLISVRAPVGDVNIANMDYCIGRGLASISFKNGYGCNEYLFYCLQFLKPLLEKEGYGSTFKAINKEVLTKFQIPLPPLEEQQKIAQILQSIDQRIEKEEKYKNALQNLFKSLLHNLMTGKIRVRVKDHGED